MFALFLTRIVAVSSQSSWRKVRKTLWYRTPKPMAAKEEIVKVRDPTDQQERRKDLGLEIDT
jgi:hypothetical protein